MFMCIFWFAPSAYRNLLLGYDDIYNAVAGGGGGRHSMNSWLHYHSVNAILLSKSEHTFFEVEHKSFNS